MHSMSILPSPVSHFLVPLVHFFLHALHSLLHSLVHALFELNFMMMVVAAPEAGLVGDDNASEDSGGIDHGLVASHIGVAEIELEATKDGDHPDFFDILIRNVALDLSEDGDVFAIGGF